LIDIVILVGLLIVVGLAFGKAHTHGGSASVHLTGVSALIWALLAFAYYTIAEALGGQTLGKLLLHLRVRSAAGDKASLGPVVLRNVLRIVDGLPLFYLVGFIVMLSTGSRAQRIGDLAANTIVIRAN